MQKPWVKTKFTAFLDAIGIIPEKQSENGEFYKGMIKRLTPQLQHVGPRFRTVGPGIFCTKMHWRILLVMSPSFW
jgi:hypothetical protein